MKLVMKENLEDGVYFVKNGIITRVQYIEWGYEGYCPSDKTSIHTEKDGNYLISDYRRGAAVADAGSK